MRRRKDLNSAPRKDTWFVKLTATDGRICRWQFDRCTLAHVKELIRDYVWGCPYDCRWIICGGGMKIIGEMNWPDLTTDNPDNR